MLPVRIDSLQIPAINDAENPNSTSFQHSVVSRIISGTEWQVVVYWAQATTTLNAAFGRKLVIAVRSVPSGKWVSHIYDGTGGRPDITVASPLDSHDVANVEIDANGYIHVWYGMHTSALAYRRSTNPLASFDGLLTATLTMTGVNETSVTYPCPFVSPDGVLYYMARCAGGSGNGDYYFYIYNEGTTSWAGAPGTGTNGLWMDGVTDSWSAYPFGEPVFTSDWDGAGAGFMHIAFTWRRDTTLTNNDVTHVRWNGTVWTEWDGAATTMPLRKGNARHVLIVAESELMMNTTRMCLDGNNHPHIIVKKLDGAGFYQINDLYLDAGATWVLNPLTAYASNGTGFSRPDIVCDKATNELFVYFTYPGNEGEGVYQLKSNPGDFSTWTKSTFFSATIGNHDVTMDRGAWERDNLVSMFVCRGNTYTSGASNIRIVSRPPKGRIDAFSGADWTRKQAITIDPTKVGSGGVSNFTVLLTRDHFANEVVDPSGLNAAQADGGDLRFFTDDALTVPLACSIVSFGHDSATGVGDANIEIYAGPLTLSGTLDTVIYVSYAPSYTARQPFVDEAQGAQSAYDANWVFSTPLSAGAGPIQNISESHFTDAKTQSAFIAGKVGDGKDFNGNQGLFIGDRSLGIGSAFSFASWVSVDAAPAADFLVFGADSENTKRGMHLRVSASTGTATMLRFDSSNVLQAGLNGTTDLRAAGFKRVVWEFTAAAGQSIYVNSVIEGSDAVTTAQNDSAALLWGIGYRHRAAAPYGDTFAAAIIDSAGLHKVARGAAWWVTDYNNTNAPSTFAVAGAAAAIADGTTPTLSLPLATSITSSSVVPQVTLTFA